ncbi:MAG: thiamine pyrophosphate-dependent enzyme, partial [Candidatus Wallbacteria bacterium]|nr:thiamine pyrophosphate-dependent enzyme [Candidatus Wallbacteria bacterium]
GENFSVIFINNAIYGMTGGQMAPTTLVGQKSSTSPYGRDPKFAGYPIKVCEMLATLKAPRYIERTALNNVANLNKTKKAIRKAIELQEKKEGFTFVEVLSPCPTNWGKNPVESMDWLEKVLMPEYPLGVFRDQKPEEAKS